MPKQIKNFIADCILLAFGLFLLAGALSCLNTDLEDVRITEDRVAELGKQYRIDQQEMKRQEKALRAEATLYTGIK